MATFYVWSGATGTGDGSSWANAYTTLNAALANTAFGSDFYYVAHDHLESTAATVQFTPSTAEYEQIRVLCVNRLGTVPPTTADLTTGAEIRVTGANSGIYISKNMYVQGIKFYAGFSGGVSGCDIRFNWSNNTNLYFKNCVFQLGSTGGSALYMSSAGGSRVILENCDLVFGHLDNKITTSTNATSSYFEWRGGTLSGTQANSLFDACSGDCILRGVDLSIGTVSNLSTGSNPFLRLINCKLGTGTFFGSPSSSQSGGYNFFIDCSDNGTRRTENYTYGGSTVRENTIVRQTGAADDIGSYSWKLSSSGFMTASNPHRTFEGEFWNTDVGTSKTLTVHTVTDNVTLTDAEIWLEVEYISSSTAFTTSVVTNWCGVLGTGANHTTDTATWTTTGLTTPVKQKLEVSFTPQAVGPIRWRIIYAHSGSIYVCPKADLA